ncbi:MAG: anti-sigma factor [Rhizonema sp. NSF051]|nr:anti-sigma factor [Rhizonema sp. NSF051]
MTEPLTPEAIETLAAGYVVGDLDRAEVEVFEQLLAENPVLVAEVKRLQATLDLVVYNLNSVEPPPHLQSVILTAATKTFQTSQHKQSRLLWQTVIGSVAALVILSLGVDNYRLRQDHRIAQDINTLLQQPQTKFFSLKPVNVSVSATGSFVVNLEQRQGILAVQNLATPPANKVYRLWAIADGEKIPCGTLNSTLQGKVLEKFWMPADFYDTGISGLFVTLESSGTSRYPTGSIVMQSTMSTKI